MVITFLSDSGLAKSLLKRGARHIPLPTEPPRVFARAKRVAFGGTSAPKSAMAYHSSFNDADFKTVAGIALLPVRLTAGARGPAAPCPGSNISCDGPV